MLRTTETTSQPTVTLSTSPTYQINVLTLNIASLPYIFGKQINGDFLRANDERAEAIAESIISWNQASTETKNAPDIICFQEAWHGLFGSVRNYLIKELSSIYPYNSGDLGQEKYSPVNAGSGLLLFSKFPIVETYYYHYTNGMFGDEILASKGFIEVKLKLDEEYFITAYTTHLTCDATFPKMQVENRTLPGRRGEEFAILFERMQTNRDEPPTNMPNLKYAGSIACGDFNTTLDDESRVHAISSGMGKLYKANRIKYPGQNAFASLLPPLGKTYLSNFKEVRVLPEKKGQRKPVDPKLEQEAENENLFTGTTYNGDALRNNLHQKAPATRQGTDHRVIDGLFATEDTCEEFETKIVSLNEVHNELTKKNYPYLVSDHLAVCGMFKLNPNKPNLKQHAASQSSTSTPKDDLESGWEIIDPPIPTIKRFS